jgi:hypothetical protein
VEVATTPIKLFLDDVREPPDSTWELVKTVAEAIALMETGDVTEASLDNDLGLDEEGNELPEGRTFLYWMCEHNCWPTEAITIHSANVVAVKYMLGMLQRYGPFISDRGRWTTWTTRFVRASDTPREPST